MDHLFWKIWAQVSNNLISEVPICHSVTRYDLHTILKECYDSLPSDALS